MPPFADKIAAQIQKIPNKTRYIGFGVVIGLAVCAFIYFFYIPMNTQIKQLDKELRDLQATIAQNDARIKKLDELRAEVKSLQERLKVLTEQLPPGSEVSGLLRQLQNLVSQSGLTLKLWRPSKQRTHSSGLYEEIPITMELTGGYHDTARFLDQVSKMTRIVNMLNLSMTGATMNKAGVMEIKISSTAMTFAAVEKKTDAASPTKPATK
jgi:type IV pilus assembly protein PilO